MPWVQLKKCTISAEVKTQRERWLASPWGGVVSYSLVRAESSQNPALVSSHIPGYSPLVFHWNPLSLTLRLESPRLNPRLLSLSYTVSSFPWVHLYIYTSIYTSIHDLYIRLSSLSLSTASMNVSDSLCHISTEVSGRHAYLIIFKAYYFLPPTCSFHCSSHLGKWYYSPTESPRPQI